MALTPKLITSNTPLAALTLLAMILGSGWAFVEFAPDRGALPFDDLIQPGYSATAQDGQAPRHDLDAVFSPNDRPEDPALCAWTAEQVFQHFRPMTRGERLTFHTEGIAGLVGAYIDLRCPSAIHEGDWNKTAQILGVGIVYQTLRPQADVYAPNVDWDPRADALVPTATSTYKVLSPTKTCRNALRQDRLPKVAHDELTPLMPICLEAFEN